jgi:hypothetical protein
MELIQQNPLLPFAEAPFGTKLACQIVVGIRADGSYALEERLPSGIPFNANNPAHMFGLFIVQNAQQLMGFAMQAQKEAQVIQQCDEIIAKASLQGV